MRKDERFELSAPPRFGLVCFHLKVILLCVSETGVLPCWRLQTLAMLLQGLSISVLQESAYATSFAAVAHH